MCIVLELTFTPSSIMSANQTSSSAPPNTPNGAGGQGDSAPSINGETTRHTEERGTSSNSGPYVTNTDGLLRDWSDEDRWGLESAIYSLAQ